MYEILELMRDRDYYKNCYLQLFRNLTLIHTLGKVKNKLNLHFIVPKDLITLLIGKKS